MEANHIMQITAYQIMQANLSNFNLITVTYYCENNKKKYNKGVPPTPPLSKIECIF